MFAACRFVGRDQLEAGRHDPRIQRLLKAIEHDPAHNIVSLARLLNLSRSRLSHLFKSTMGCSLNSFLTRCRLERAATLLLQTDLPVKEISYNVGYSHPSSFVRAFRQKFACSPNTYRSRAPILTNNSRFG